MVRKKAIYLAQKIGFVDFNSGFLGIYFNRDITLCLKSFVVTALAFWKKIVIYGR